MLGMIPAVDHDFLLNADPFAQRLAPVFESGADFVCADAEGYNF
jgi:hypothetical protein